MDASVCNTHEGSVSMLVLTVDRVYCVDVGVTCSHVCCCQVIHLSHWPLLRDSVYYTLSISALIVVRILSMTWTMSLIHTYFPFSNWFFYIPSQFIYDEKVVW